MRFARNPGFWRAALLALLFGAVTASAYSGNAVLHRQKAPRRESKAVQPAKPAPLLLKIGEKLDYRVSWTSFSSAASVELTVVERRVLYGWDTWHLLAVAHTLNTVRALFVVDDQFDSYADAATLESHQYEMHTRELGRQQDLIMRLVAQGLPARGPVPAIIVPPGTRDPVGALYSLRLVDWQHTPEFRAPVYDGKQLYEMRAVLEAAHEQVSVIAGSYAAARIGIHLYEHAREVTGTHFELWLTLDAARTPLKIEAEVPFGTLDAELTAASR